MKCLAFDLGRVIFGFDYNIALEKIKSKIGMPTEEIIQKLFYSDFTEDLEKGLICDYDFYLKFKKAFSASLSYDEFINVWCDIFWPDEEVIDLIEKLRITYPLYLISNISRLHFQYLYEKYPYVFSLFRDLILSFKVKSVKPEKRIYQELRKASKKSYRNIIYIDDREDLISQARKLNLKCIRFTNLDELIRELNSLKIIIP